MTHGKLEFEAYSGYHEAPHPYGDMTTCAMPGICLGHVGNLQGSQTPHPYDKASRKAL